MADKQLDRRDTPYVMENYDPNKTYRFVDKDGNVFYSKGDNGYVQQSMTQGIPISVNSNGDWYTEPYLESDGTNLIAHIPNWFKTTEEYNTWSNIYNQMPSTGLNKEYLSEANNYLKSLGSQGALRWTLKNDIATYGVTDKALQDKYFDWMLSMGLEGREGGEKAKIKGLFGDDRERSVEDIARDYKNMSKEDLSSVMMNLYNTAQKGKDGTFEGDQEEMLSTVALVKMLNWVDDNYKNYGKDEEFSGLLEASTWQKFVASEKSFMQTMAEGMPILNLGTRAIYGLGEVMKGNDFSMKIEDAREDLLNSPDAGGGLENSDQFNGIGNVIGTVGNIAGTMTLSVALGNVISGTTAAATPGSFVSNLGNYAMTIPGAAVTDFFLNDLPIDLIFFATDWARTGDPGKAWLNTEESQPLFGIPVIGHFGPQVWGGLATNLLGDVIIDAALPILSIAGNTSYKKLDLWTSGGVTRTREKAALLNLKLQEKLTNIPVVGDAWKSFVNYMMGAENASFIREARKQAIIEGSMEPYVKAQNNLTSYNHAGMDIIHPMYKKLDTDLEISKSLKNFSKNANNLGGVGEVKVSWKEAKRGVTKTFSKTVQDTMPRDVKRVLLDTERLSELKGELKNEGGLLFNPLREKEIAAIEERLAKAPQELKDFAKNFSDLNKGVESIGVKLGVTNEEWLDALNADPRWNAYMTRQALTPGGVGTATAGGSMDPTNAAILNKSRVGTYNPDNYIDPMLALSLKTEALGRAYVWNERTKLVVASEIAQGNVRAGKNGTEVAKRLAEVKADIKAKSALRQAIDYDVTVKKFSDDMSTVSKVFNDVNDLLHLPETLNLKALYDIQQSPRIKGMISDFESGKLQFADGVKAAVGLSDSDAAAVVRNTYVYRGMEPKNRVTKTQAARDASGEVKMRESLTSSGTTLETPEIEVDSLANKEAEFMSYDTQAKTTKPKGVDYNAGMTADGRAFKYEIKNNKIVSMEEITDAEGMAVALAHVGGSFNITANTVDEMGIPLSQALGRTIMFYRDNMPDLGITSRFEMRLSDSWGYVEWPSQWDMYEYRKGNKVLESNPYGFAVDKNGKLTMGELPVIIGTPAYKKGDEARILRDKVEETASGFKPKNTATLESTPTHENGHATVNKLGVLELNRRIDAGEIPKLTSWEEGAMRVAEEIDRIQDMMVHNALAKLGVEDTPANRQRYGATISEYASKPVRRMSDPMGPVNAPSEIFSEAMRMYQGNGADSSPFCLAIVEEMKKLSEQHSHVAAPGDVFVKNGLTPPNGLFKNGQYAFPSTARSAKARGEWLDEWRQKNPYLNKKFDEETYQKANLWDTYFQREIYSFNEKAKSSMPDKLAKKNGKFLEELSTNAAKQMVTKIREASITGFSEKLATMALSRNSADVADAMDSFIISRVNKSAREIAKKMPGGLTEENIIRARATVWSEDILKNEVASMLSKLVPDIDNANIVSKVDELFKQQAEGFAAVDILPVETKQLIGEKEQLKAQLMKENAHSIKTGKKADTELPSKGYISDETQVIHYKEGGEDVYVVVNDPVYASILKRPTEYKSTGVAVEALAQTSNFIARMYRIGTTSISPLAFVRNVLRDPLQATFQGGFNPINMNLSPEVFYHTLRQYGLDDATINEVTTRLHNWASTSTLTAEMRNMGIESNMPGYKNSVEKASKKMNKILDNKIIERAEAPLEAWESMFRNQIAQQSFVKNFERTGDVNKAMGVAMLDASNSTTNFSHSVGLFKRATSTVPYLSSAINGTRSFWVQFNMDPIGMITRLTAGGMVPMMALTAWNLSSEERKKAYMNLPEWYRDSHIVLLDLEGNVISFPIPDELKQYFGTARRLIEYTNDVNQQGIPSIMLQGAFGFLPGDFDGFFKDDGSIDWQRGGEQLLSGLTPQAVTAVYEFVFQRDTYMGIDISFYDWYDRVINLASNIFGSFVKNIFNDIGMICGAPEDMFIGKSTADTLSRDLFGMGFDTATQQFMNLIGDPSEVDPKTGKKKEATGLYAENEKLQLQIKDYDKKIATSTGEEKEKYEQEKAQLIENFQKRVASLVNNYMNLYTQTGGLQEWQKYKVINILTLGESFSSANSNSYQGQDSSQSYLDERSLAMGRYVDAGLPAGASEESILNHQDSIAVQAALNRYYGVAKQAAADFKTALKESGLKDIRNKFYEAVGKVYDIADETGTKPDYDLIEKIQARYLQAVDGILAPIVNQYGLAVLNNNDFIDEVRRYVNGMVPSNDWKQSERNAKKYLSAKDFPLATVDVKKWLIERYSSGMQDRGFDSDQTVKDKIQDIKATIDRGEKSAAKGKIKDLFKGVNSASYYISPSDMQTLYNWNNMLK